MIAFLLGSVGRWVIGAGLAALVVGGGFLWVKTHYEDIGYQKALAAVAAQDQRAIDAAGKARTTVTMCFDSGGTWNVENGTCEKSE